MDSIKNSVLNYKITSPNDKKFIKDINRLIKKEGNCVCQAVFKLFTDLDLSDYEARKSWFDIVYHREFMSAFLGRDVALIAAMSDYFSNLGKRFENPKIVEFDTFEKVLKDSRHDNLTGLLNRGCILEILDGHIAQAKRHNTEMTILFLDVDDFKFFNDTFGHQAGDRVLTSVAKVLLKESRLDDLAIRYGGEEFVVIMPNTGIQEALVLAERIRKGTESLILNVEGKKRYLTISGGIASYPTDANDGSMLLDMADKALYRAKDMGKNNISIYSFKQQRRYSRSKLVRPVKIKKIGFDSTPPILGASKDIGMGGILFETAHRLDVGSNIEVSLPIMNADPLFLIGNVVRVQREKKGNYDTGMAMSFKEMEKAARDEISTFLIRRQAGINVPNIVEM